VDKKFILTLVIATIFVSLITGCNSSQKKDPNQLTLYEAIKQNKDASKLDSKKDERLIEKLQRFKKDPNLFLENGYTLLTYAAYKKNFKFIDKLLKNKKVDLNKRDKHGNSILTILLQQQDYRRASIMMEYSDITFNDNERKDFVKSLKKDDLKAIKWCIKRSIPLDGSTVVNDYFSKAKFDVQLGLIYLDPKLSQDNIKLFRKRYAGRDLDEIAESYERVQHLLTHEDKKIIFDKIMQDNNDYYGKLVKYVLDDSIKIPESLAKKLNEKYISTDTYVRDDFAKAIFFHLYKHNRNIFDKINLTHYALSHHWPDVLQMLINDGVRDENEYKELMPNWESVETLKVLIDNGYEPRKNQSTIFHNAMLKSEAYYKYILQNNIYIALASDGTNLFVASLNNKTNKLTIFKLDDQQNKQWEHTFDQKYYINSVNNIVGLYYFHDKLMLIQKALIGADKKTKLIILSKDGKKIKTLELNGEYISAVFLKDNFFVQTYRDIKKYDAKINPIEIDYVQELFRRKNLKSDSDKTVVTKYLPDKTIRLSYNSYEDSSKLYIKKAKDNKSYVLKLADKKELVTDVAETKQANFILVQTPQKSSIVKLTPDYGIWGYRYIDKEEKENISSMDFVSQKLKLKNGNIVIVGKNNNLPTLEIYNKNKKKIVDKSYKFSYMRGHINNIEELENSDLLVVGRIYQNYNFKKVFVALLDSKATPKWSRIYHEVKYIDNIAIDSNSSFITLMDYNPVSVSLKDGHIIKKYKEIEDADELAISKSGQITVLANKKTKRKRVYKPSIYCFDKNSDTMKKNIVGSEGEFIKNIYTNNKGVFAKLKLQEGHGSMKSDTILTKITDSCELKRKWKEE